MESKEILKFLMQQGLLVDKELLKIFSDEEDLDSVKLIVEKLKNSTHQKIITKEVLERNKDQVGVILSSLPQENQEKLESLKIKLGLTLEISKEVILKKEEEKPILNEGSVRVQAMNYPLGKKFEVKDFVAYFRNRFAEIRGVLQDHSVLDNLVSINKISGNRQGISVIGLVYAKAVTKNQNIIFEIEDLTGKIKVLVNKSKEELHKKALEIPLDAVVGFKCAGNREILFVNDIVFPEAVLLERKKSPVEECAIFISDVHMGSKNFMRDGFMRLMEYLNNHPESKKIKYLFIVGDLITGVGNYPDQEKDLAIVNLEDQYTSAAELLGKIRKDIKIIISPGNHEGVRLMEPQPLFDEKYAWALYDLENVLLVGNPAIVNIGAVPGFNGFNVLLYHGFSYPFFADSVSRLKEEKAMNSPEKIMTYLLKFRHLAPTHGSVQYFPGETDCHFIRDIPDIFVSGHTHKSAVTYYNNVLVISGSSWETLTPYQEKFGNTPDHCKVPLINLKTREVKILDFE
jgi:DNA polymerase II small subunit